MLFAQLGDDEAAEGFVFARFLLCVEACLPFGTLLWVLQDFACLGYRFGKSVVEVVLVGGNLLGVFVFGVMAGNGSAESFGVIYIAVMVKTAVNAAEWYFQVYFCLGDNVFRVIGIRGYRYIEWLFYSFGDVIIFCRVFTVFLP